MKSKIKKTIQNFKQSNVINKDKQEQMNTFFTLLTLIVSVETGKHFPRQ